MKKQSKQKKQLNSWVSFFFQFLFLPLLFMGFVYMGGFVFVYMHESVHQEIFKTYNITSTATINYLDLSGVTSASSEDYNEKCDEYCRLSNDMNEVVGYHTGVIITNLWLIFFAWFFYSQMRS